MKIDVDTSQTQPKQQGFHVTRELIGERMPLAPGSRSTPLPEPNPPRTPKLAVANVPNDDPGLPERMPVPPSSVFKEPPSRVVGSEQRQPSVP